MLPTTISAATLESTAATQCAGCGCTQDVAARGPLRTPVCPACWLDAARKAGFTPRSHTGSWHPEAEDGTHARITAPRSRDGWIALVADLLAREDTASVLAKYRKKIGRAGILACARVIADAADPAGRRCLLAHATIATRALQVDPSLRGKPNAKVACQILRELGLIVTVTTGRRLTRAERAAANEVHGGHQRNIANETALTYPGPETAAQEPTCTPLPRRGQVSKKPNSQSVVTNARKRTRGENSKPSRSKAAWKLASKCVEWLPHLAAGHLGALADLMQPLTERGWTLHDIRLTLDQANIDRGWNSIPVEQQRNPRALFASQITRLCHGTPPSAAPTPRPTGTTALALSEPPATPENVAQHLSHIRRSLSEGKRRRTYRTTIR